MSPGAPSGTRIVVYFLLITLVLTFCSLFSPLTFGTVQEIPLSPPWGNPIVIDDVFSRIQVPSFAVDSRRDVHVVYSDKVDDHVDIFYTAVRDSTVSDPVNVTEYPSLKESVTTGINSAGQLYAAFLDNRKGRWQVFLLNVSDNQLIQVTDTETHKEDVFLTIGGNNKVVITWTEVREGNPCIFLAVIDTQLDILVNKCIFGEYPSTKASTVSDEEKIHIVYLEKRVYDHIMYSQLDFSGESLITYDLGECIHLDPVSLGVYKGPQCTVADTVVCVWSDFRTGSHDLYYTEVTKEGVKEVEQLTHYPIGTYSWMPSIADQKGVTHIVYLNNGFGHRLFHSQIDEEYQELGTITVRWERATAPSLICDDEGILHCVYLRFREDGNFDVVYKNTYPHKEKVSTFSERMEESSIQYVYSFVLSFLFAFPLTVKDNFLGIVLLVGGFFAFRFFKVKEVVARVKGSEHLLFVVGIVVLFLLRGIVDYSYLAPVAYERAFVVYGFFLSFAASVVFKYLLGTRFDSEVRILLSCLVFVYWCTFFLLLPVIPHI